MRTSPDELILKRPQLSVGLLSANLLRLEEELEVLAQAEVRLVHVDVMDGVFCPQMTVGPPIVKALPDRFVKDVHLMIDEPLAKIHDYVESGADIITFHLESTSHPHRVLQSLSGSGVVRGVALNPGSEPRTIEPLLDEVELVMLLAVNPGWGGQSFIASTERRVRQLRELIEDREIAVAVDGGVTRSNIAQVASLGVDVVVAGSAVFEGGAAAENARFLAESLARASKPFVSQVS